MVHPPNWCGPYYSALTLTYASYSSSKFAEYQLPMTNVVGYFESYRFNLKEHRVLTTYIAHIHQNDIKVRIITSTVALKFFILNIVIVNLSIKIFL